MDESDEGKSKRRIGGSQKKSQTLDIRNALKAGMDMKHIAQV